MDQLLSVISPARMEAVAVPAIGIPHQTVLFVRPDIRGRIVRPLIAITEHQSIQIQRVLPEAVAVPAIGIPHQTVLRVKRGTRDQDVYTDPIVTITVLPSLPIM